MKKLSVLIALMLCITIGGVYATWTYTQTTDVADESVGAAMNLTGVAYAGSYGTYEIDKTTLVLTIDPKNGTSHTTSLLVAGEIVVKFTPSNVAPVEIKESGVPTTFSFALSNDAWTFDDGHGGGPKNIIALKHAGSHDVVWNPVGDGTFTFTLTAANIAEHLELTEFVLDTKTLYDEYTVALRGGQIVFGVTDGSTAGAASN